MGLAVCDSAWNLVQDIPLTSHSAADNISAASSWVEIHDGRIYASWAEVIEGQGGGGTTPLQDYVSVFEITTGSTSCTSFTISPGSASATASAGSQAVTVTGSPSGCRGGSWTASGNGSWLTVSPASGEGSGSVTVSWEANTDPSPRTGTATIAGQTFTVTQAGWGGTSYPYSYWLPVIAHSAGAGGTQPSGAATSAPGTRASR